MQVKSGSRKVGIETTLEELLTAKADARGFSFLPRQPVASLLAGRHSSRLRGRGLAFEELRPYTQGDDIRTIDWKATARLRSPHVRVYIEERERPVYVIVDQRPSMFFGSRRAMKSVTAAEVAALAAWRALASGDRVGGVVFNNHELIELRPHRSQTRVLRLLHEIVRLNQELANSVSSLKETEPTVDLNQALEAASRRANHDHLVVLISDLDGANAETQRIATKIASHNDMLVIGVYDPLGAALRGQPGMIAHDRGQNFAVPADGRFPESFQNQFASLLVHWQTVFRSLRIPVIPVSTATLPVDQLRGFFGSQTTTRAGN